MFYCDECAHEKNWPQSVNPPVNHVCEVCGKITFCNDVTKEEIQEFQNKYGGNTWRGNLQRKLDGSHGVGTLDPTGVWRSFMGPSHFAMPPGGMPEFQIRDKDLDDLLRMALNGALRGSGPLVMGPFDNPEEAMQVCHEIIQIVQESPSPEIAMQRVIEYIQNRKGGGSSSGQGTDSGDPFRGRYR